MADSKRFTFEKISQNMPFQKNTKESREWFRNTALNIRQMSVPEFQRNATPFQNVENLSTNSIGKMYSFVYDPKWKEELPYYDTFPLIFPLAIFTDPKSKEPKMHGLNMHYLPYGLRARLMNALYGTINNQAYNKTTKLQINYNILKGASQFKYYKPCFKEYILSHVRSPFMNIKPEAWDYTLFLPLARFQKKSQDYVFLQSALSVR